MSSSTFVSFFRQKIYPSAYKITTFLFSKRRQNLKTVKCVSNFKKWFVMMINAWDHLDSCIWGWQGGQLAPKNAEFGQNRPFSEVQGQSNDPPDNPKSYRYIYNIKNIYCIYIILVLKGLGGRFWPFAHFLETHQLLFWRFWAFNDPPTTP